LTSTTPEQQAEAEAWLANWIGVSQSAGFDTLDQQIQNDPNFVQAELLLTFGLLTEAMNQYDRTMDNWDENPLALYQLSLTFADRGVYNLSIQAADRLVRLSPETDPEKVPVFIRRLIYPTYYADLILPLTESLNLDPALVFALIRQESFYDPNALSIAGARGLMHIMPPTGADIAQRTSTANYTLESLWQPYRNIQFGAWYLRQMMDFFDNNQFAALAAYNAGPGRVQEWSPLLSDLDIFVAHIPLSEPQNYIRRIYLNLDNYREIYGVDQSTASTE
jgi:soluble lytic murein transglycosylase